MNKLIQLSPEPEFTTDDFDTYLATIIHGWLKTLAAFAYILVPAFFILDQYTMPPELVPRFGFYRLASTIVVLIQFFIICYTRPSRWSYIHGYFITINVGGIIALMTVDLGGFNASYYAGLNLVIIGVNLLLPWKAIHSVVNSAIVVGMYISFNVLAGQPFDPRILTNNLFFMVSTAILAVSINHVKYKLVKKEFSLLAELKNARDALWSEMELAKQIQTALLPDKDRVKGFDIAATMKPAKEVGGDYYDVIETPTGDKWITMGDVSGHGVGSGLIMMMAQTSILSAVNKCSNGRPSDVLKLVNSVIRENISRLGSDHYMTMMAVRLNGTEMIVSGKHQDIIVYRSATQNTEVIPTQGTWLGIADDIGDHLKDVTTSLHNGDVIVMFTDGITEAANTDGQLFGQVRIEQVLNHCAHFPVGKIRDKIMESVESFHEEQLDDMTVVVIKKCAVR